MVTGQYDLDNPSVETPLDNARLCQVTVEVSWDKETWNVSSNKDSFKEKNRSVDEQSRQRTKVTGNKKKSFLTSKW